MAKTFSSQVTFRGNTELGGQKNLKLITYSSTYEFPNFVEITGGLQRPDESSQNSCHVAMVEPPMSYLESTVRGTACEIAVLIKIASCACFACRALSLRPPSTSCTISARLPLLWQEKGYCRRAGCSRYSEWLPEGGAPGRRRSARG